MTPTSNRQRLVRALGWTAFLCTAAVLLFLVARFATIERANARKIARLQQARDELRATADRMETDRRQAEIDKRVVWSLLQQCRDVDDLPDLGGDRVFAYHQGLEDLRFYVPQGRHTLAISASWGPREPSTASEDEDAGPAGPVGEKTWRVPLLPACGYWLQFKADRQGGPVGWELTSREPAFKTRQEAIPLDGFSQQGWALSSSSAAAYPNQIRGVAVNRLKSAPKASPGVELVDGRLHGTRDERGYDVSLSVVLLTDGPACVAASDAQRLIVLGRETLLLPYEGGGRYDIRTAE